MVKKAVILAGGEGTRLRPVTLEIPKPLVPVQGVPILSWLVRWFAAYGVEEATVVYPTKWKTAFVAWHAKEDGVTSVSLFEEPEPMGTMGAMAHLMDIGTDPFFVTNGDELKSLDLARLAAFHHERKHHLARVGGTIALIRVPNPQDYGVAEMDGEMIARFHEKPEQPPSDLVSSGLYLIEPSSFHNPPVSSERFLMLEKDLFPRLANTGRLAGCRLDGQWYDCGTLARWERAIREWRGLDVEPKLR